MPAVSAADTRVAIYARVSTKDQSCEMQLRDLRTYCGARDYQQATEYVDTGHSGAKDSRPELNRMMDDVRKRKIDAVIVWRFDRFARSTKHLLTALEEFRALGIQFISYQENMDSTSPLGQALFTIVAAVAQLERDLIRERVTAGIRNARAAGKQLGRPVRYFARKYSQPPDHHQCTLAYQLRSRTGWIEGLGYSRNSSGLGSLRGSSRPSQSSGLVRYPKRH